MNRKEKIENLLNIFSKINYLDELVYNILNERIYDKYVSPLIMSLDDLLFISLLNDTYDNIHNSFNTPGEKNKTKPILWDHKNGGYPPETLLDYFKNIKSGQKISKSLISKVKYQIKLIKKVQKELN